MTALRTLARTCDFRDIRDSLIRDRIVLGVVNPRLSRRLLAAGDPDLPKTRAMAWRFVEPRHKVVGWLLTHKILVSSQPRAGVSLPVPGCRAGVGATSGHRERHTCTRLARGYKILPKRQSGNLQKLIRMRSVNPHRSQRCANGNLQRKRNVPDVEDITSHEDAQHGERRVGNVGEPIILQPCGQSTSFVHQMDRLLVQRQLQLAKTELCQLQLAKTELCRHLIVKRKHMQCTH